MMLSAQQHVQPLQPSTGKQDFLGDCKKLLVAQVKYSKAILA